MSSYNMYDEFDYSKLKPIPGLPYQYPVSHYLKGHRETRPKEEPCPTWVSKGFQHQEEVFDFEVTHGLPGKLHFPGELEVPFAEPRIKKASPAEGVFKYTESCQMQSRNVEMHEARLNEERLFASRALAIDPAIATQLLEEDAAQQGETFCRLEQDSWIDDPRYPPPQSVLDLTCSQSSPSLQHHDKHLGAFVMGVFDHSPFSGRECLSSTYYESPRFAAHVGHLSDPASDVLPAVSGPSYQANSWLNYFTKGDVLFPRTLMKSLRDGNGYDLVMADCTTVPPKLEQFRYRSRWVEWWNFRRFLSAVQVVMEMGGHKTVAKFKLAGVRMEGTLVILRYLRRCFDSVRIQFCHFQDPLSADIILTVAGLNDSSPDQMGILNLLVNALNEHRQVTWTNIGAWLPRKSAFRANMRNVVRTQDAILSRFAKMVLRSFYIKYGKGQLDLDHPPTGLLTNARPITRPHIVADVPHVWGPYGPRTDPVFATNAMKATIVLGQIMHADQRANGTCVHDQSDPTQVCACFYAYQRMEHGIDPPILPMWEEAYPEGGWVYAPPPVRSQLAKRLRDRRDGEILPVPLDLRAPFGPGEYGAPSGLRETDTPARHVDGYIGYSTYVVFQAHNDPADSDSDDDVDDDDEYEFYNVDDTY